MSSDAADAIAAVLRSRALGLLVGKEKKRRAASFVTPLISACVVGAQVGVLLTPGYVYTVASL